MDIARHSDDAPDFIAQVEACANGVLRVYAPKELVLINIDNWFSQKWLHFSGKALGAVGVWRSDQSLAVPPFVPNRVRSERRFTAPEYLEVTAPNSVHVAVESQHALHRRMSNIVPDASAIWYGGGSLRSGRGSVMAYLLHDDSYWTWYVELAESRSWEVVQANGITPLEFSAFGKPEGNISPINQVL
jgi:hypothetical protein